MDTTVEEMAGILRSTNTMADQFAKTVQDRVGKSVEYDEILAVMKKTPAKSLTMAKIVAKLRRQLEKQKK